MRLVQDMISRLDTRQLDQLEKEIDEAKCIFVGAQGRIFLAMKAFGMRLMQTGHTTYIVGDPVAPGIKEGDLLIVASSSGDKDTTLSMVQKAKEVGARTALLTMNPNKRIGKIADTVVVIPDAPEPQNEAEAFVKKNITGNWHETALIITLDGLTANLMVNKGYNFDTLHAVHANLQ